MPESIDRGSASGRGAKTPRVAKQLSQFLACILAALSTGASPAMASDGTAVAALTLIDGSQGLGNFKQIGGGNWRASGNAIQADRSTTDYAYLLTKEKYADFRLTIEFWASEDANSGVFLRCQDPQNITAENCYEANIFDQRPDPSYGTGAIVLVAKAPVPMPKAGGRWNTYDITLNRARLTLVLNGVTTVDIEDAKLASGHLALQWGSGIVKFRKLVIQPL